ncbi:ABC transporter ATP-binding protein [Pseudothauera rhizosphaerae]|uniref:ABC transporter ATP-binding protein n=1 Tax=Pseudothauera rhizosphaerae TaxID=2565932 RepID=A0A4S4AMW6_9RHOO|nr:ABC transporter ATP-binding protein [Pseudothauera rhizosphaerae]THF60961.1 ABC transporter ATP-binding protein [Pseudothauera rhizosphaerae]
MNPPAPPRLRLAGIRKVYPTVVANDGIALAVEAGEIHAVLGENGAGKSTLMKIIYGAARPSAGEMWWEGERVEVANPAQARALGIGMVFQHFSLFETLTVAENVALALPGKPPLSELARRIEEVSQHYGLPVDPRRHVHALSVGERQRVEIVRCLLQNPKLLIMDEPTSVLTPQAVEKLFDTLRQLAAEGCSILYISHKLDEIQALCHTATVLRGGRVSGHCRPAEETPQSMARLMTGRDLPVCEHGPAAAGGEVRLRLAGLSHASDDPFGTDLKDIHLDVHAGEIVGIAGVSGNGQQELLRAISGEDIIAEKFPVQICGVEAGRLSAGRRRRLGLCFVPEERLGRGTVPSMSLTDNAVLTAARNARLVHAGFVAFGRARRFAAECIARFDVRCGGPQVEAESLSGGNLQKFIVGREMLQAPRVFVCAQPTWGVDVGAAAFIRQAIIDLRNRGCAVLVVSEELDELFEICDRIAVMAQGRLSPARPAAETGVENIGLWMSGLWPGADGSATETGRAAA